MQANVTYDRISQNPNNFQKVFDQQMGLAERIRDGKTEVKVGAVESKALIGATKSLEVDIRARIFENQLRRQPELPNGEEGNKSIGKDG